MGQLGFGEEDLREIRHTKSSDKSLIEWLTDEWKKNNQMKNKIIKLAKVIKEFPNNSGIIIDDILMYANSRYHNVTIKENSYTQYYSIDEKEVEKYNEHFELMECNHRNIRRFTIEEEVTSPLIPKEYEHKGIIKSISTINDIDYVWVEFGSFMMPFTIDYNIDKTWDLFHYHWTEEEVQTNKIQKYMSEFKKYAEFVESLKVYPYTATIIYPALGLCGEAGEVAEKIKKIIRDKGSVYTPEDKAEIVKELGDVLFYVTALAKDLGFSLEYVAGMNVEKLMSRKERNVLHGNGDNR